LVSSHVDEDAIRQVRAVFGALQEGMSQETRERLAAGLPPEVADWWRGPPPPPGAPPRGPGGGPPPPPPVRDCPRMPNRVPSQASAQASVVREPTK
ncbi:MAG: DUF2267 domain-containing protein, partial [Armatimonadetes bacterium]|nr:DUF2267 domain-containing protein [Armatimonadota bacterium]